MMILPISADNVAFLLHSQDAFMQKTMLYGYANRVYVLQWNAYVENCIIRL